VPRIFPAMYFYAAPLQHHRVLHSPAIKIRSAAPAMPSSRNSVAPCHREILFLETLLCASAVLIATLPLQLQAQTISGASRLAGKAVPQQVSSQQPQASPGRSLYFQTTITAVPRVLCKLYLCQWTLQRLFRIAAEM